MTFSKFTNDLLNFVRHNLVTKENDDCFMHVKAKAKRNAPIELHCSFETVFAVIFGQ